MAFFTSLPNKQALKWYVKLIWLPSPKYQRFLFHISKIENTLIEQRFLFKTELIRKKGRKITFSVSNLIYPEFTFLPHTCWTYYNKYISAADWEQLEILNLFSKEKFCLKNTLEVTFILITCLKFFKSQLYIWQVSIINV